MALRIEAFDVDVTVRRGTRWSARGLVALGENVISKLGASPSRVAAAAANGQSASGLKMDQLTGNGVSVNGGVAATNGVRNDVPKPELTSGMPRFIAPPLAAPAPKPLNQPVAAPVASGSAPGTFRPLFKRLPAAEAATQASARRQPIPTAGADGGRPLDETTRRQMENFFGASLGDVRVHADASSAQLAANMGAEALTIGRDIYFGEGKFDPSSQKGKALLGHELTHVLQQRTIDPRRQGMTPGSVETLEREAQTLARRFETSAEMVRSTGFLVNRYLCSYSVNRPATDAETQRLEALSRGALEVCEETLRARHPDLLEGAERTLDTVTVDIDTSLAGHSDEDIIQVWGRRMAAAIAAKLSSQSTPTLAAPAGEVLKAPDKGKGQQPATTNITVTTQTFDIEADNLDGAAAALQSLDEWGKTRWNVTYDYDATDGVATSVAVTARITVELPRWTTLSKQPRRVQAEWNRMLAALRRHENEHVRIARERIQQLAGELLGKPESDLPDIHTRCLQDLDALSQAYDNRTAHGQNEGVTLDLNVAAQPSAKTSVDADAAEDQARAVEASIAAGMKPDHDGQLTRGRSLQRKKDDDKPSVGVPVPTAIVHEQRQLTPDFEQTNRLLDRLIAEQGWTTTHSWAYRFINADPLGDLKYGDPDLVGRCRQRLREEMTIRQNAVKDLTGAPGADFGDVVLAGGRFVTTATDITKDLLNNSEKQLKSEAAHYGLKAEGWFFKDYSMADGPAQQGLRDAAKRLAAQRRDCNKLIAAFFTAQKAAEAEARKVGPFLVAPGFLEAREAARKEWVEAEDAYRAACTNEQITYPVLAAYSTLDDAATQLESLAAKGSSALAESLYKTIDERLKNIDEVRSEIGGRFNPWKHPQIVAITKKQLSLPPWQAKVVDEKAAAVRAGEEGDDAKVWAAVAIGLGLLGAIPSGGSTLLAGVAAAASTIGAVYSLHSLYEHYKDYSLAKAETGTALDKAQAISQDEPSLMWLAFDMLDLAANALGPAMAAFKELRAAMAAAKAGGPAELKALVMVANTTRAKPQTVSRMFAAIFEGMGAGQSVDKMLKAAREALEAANPTPGKAALRDAIAAAAESLGKKKIVRYAGVNRGGAIKGIEEAITAHTGRYQGKAVREIALRVAKEFGETGHSASYVRDFDFIIMRPEGELSSMLGHEMAHGAQAIEKQIETMGTLRREFQAFHIEREILIMLPDELAHASSDAKWLRTASDEAIIAYIRSNKVYSAAITAEEAANPGINAVIDTAADAKLIEDWFLKGSAGR